MGYYPNEPPKPDGAKVGLLHESALSIRLALAWAGWLLFCLFVVTPVVLKLWPGSAGSIHRWLYQITWLGCLGWGIASFACAVRQLNAGLRPRTPIYVGLALSIVLLLASAPAARFLAHMARSTLRLHNQLPWTRPADEI